MLSHQGLLLASFFFFRSDGNRNNASRLISTLAYQFCFAIPRLRPHIESAIDLHPFILTSTLPDQIQKLIVDPLLRFFYDPNSITIDPFPRIILIDGLDECLDGKTQIEILDAFCKIVRTLPIQIAIVIASRPEYQIRSSFDLGKLNQVSSRIVLDDKFQPDKDIKMFYLDKFNEIRRTHPMESYLPKIWPCPWVIDMLVRNASGQFIYASTVIKFVGSIRHNPFARLRMVLGLTDRGTSKPFHQLDFLYTTIFRNVEAQDLLDVLRVLGIILALPRSLNGPFQFPRLSDYSFQSPKFLERLLGYHHGEIRRLFINLESLLAVGCDQENIHIYHTSLSDFLFDKARATDLYIDKGDVYADIAGLCINQFFSGFYPPIMQFLLEQFSVSLKNATPTIRLRRLIIACNMEKLGNLVSKWEYLENLEVFDILRRKPWGPALRPQYGLRVLTPMFLDALHSSNFPDAQTLHSDKVASFKKLLMPKLSVYWDDPRLFPVLMVSLTLLPAKDREKIGVAEYLASLRLFLHGVFFPKEQNLGLDLNESFCEFYPAECTVSFLRLTFDLFMDPKGPGDLMVVRTQCANLALHLLPYVNTDYDGAYSLLSHNVLCLERLLPCLLKYSVVRNDLTKTARNLLSSGPQSPSYPPPPIEDAIVSYLKRDENTHCQEIPLRENSIRWCVILIICLGLAGSLSLLMVQVRVSLWG